MRRSAVAFPALAALLAAVLAACGVSVSAPVSLTTLKAQLLAGPEAGGDYSAGTVYSSTTPPPLSTPTNWNAISASCRNWFHAFIGDNGSGQNVHTYAQEAVSSASASTSTPYVFEWIGDFSSSDPARAVASWAADSARCGSFTSDDKDAANDVSYKVSTIAAPAFGDHTAATHDTTSNNGTPGVEETVVGVFGNEIVMLDVSAGGTMAALATFTQSLLPKAAGRISHATPAPTSGGTSGEVGS